MNNDYTLSSNFGLTAFFTHLRFRDYYDSLSDELKAAVNEHESEIHSLEELHRFVERYEKLK